jgi:hypothetical protein
MKFYRVHFNNNSAISAEIDSNLGDLVHLVEENNHRFIDWLVVSADNEADAMREATNVLTQYRMAFGI